MEDFPIVLVATDDEVERLKKSRDWQKLAAEIVGWGLGWPWSKFISDFLERREPRDLPWPHMSPDEAASRFKFDLGHPRNGTAYLANPAAPEHYLLPAVFDERFVQEKMAAFVEIAEALGVKELTLKSGSLQKEQANVDASLRSAAAQAGLGAAFKADGSVERQLLMTFSAPESEPFLSPGMDGWLQMDPILRSLVNTRLRQRRLMRASVSLNLSQSSEVAAKLTAELPHMGIEAGGEYRRVQDATWAFELEFWAYKGGSDT